MTLLEEARKCRVDAQSLADRPEAPFLLQIARAFEELAELRSKLPEAPGGLPSSFRPASTDRCVFFRSKDG